MAANGRRIGQQPRGKQPYRSAGRLKRAHPPARKSSNPPSSVWWSSATRGPRPPSLPTRQAYRAAQCCITFPPKWISSERRSTTCTPSGCGRFARRWPRSPPTAITCAGVEGYWAHVKHPWFVAFFEIAVAARTDKELAAILFPAQEAFERELYEASLDLFPEWKRKGEKFLLGFDLSRYVMEGMAIAFLTHKETERDKRVLRYLEEKLKELVGEDR